MSASDEFLCTRNFTLFRKEEEEEFLCNFISTTEEIMRQ